jgi:SRSO17 transposase
MTLSPPVAQPLFDAFFTQLGALLGRPEPRASFARYASGLLSPVERKSVEPIAAWLCPGDPSKAEKMQGTVLKFLTRSRWDDAAVRFFATDFALEELTRTESLEAYVLDDTGFLKQGEHSVGVQRQYTGSAGKIANCQVAVSLTVTTPSAHLPLDMSLYLPESWTSDEARCAKARVPLELRFRTKHDIALEMLAAALLHGRPALPVLADAGYGNSSGFRGQLTRMGLTYAVGVSATTTVRVVDGTGALGPILSAKQVAEQLPRQAWRKVTWLEGTKSSLASRFTLLDVEVAAPDAFEPPRQQLLIEWPKGDKEPAHYTLVTIARGRSVKQLVRLVKSRWRTERVYEDLKGELGLDHYEGRSWVGWNHHVSVVLACSALVAVSQRRAFPPSAGGQSPGSPDAVAA